MMIGKRGDSTVLSQPSLRSQTGCSRRNSPDSRSNTLRQDGFVRFVPSLPFPVSSEDSNWPSIESIMSPDISSNVCTNPSKIIEYF